MPVYIYKVKDKTGKIIQDESTAPNEKRVREELVKRGFTIISIEEKKTSAMEKDLGSYFSKFQKVKEQALTVFARQFSTMINAGLPMVRCLDILAEQTEDTKLREVLLEVKSDVESGKTLSSSLGKHRDVFSELFISMVKAGEIGGVLDEVLDRIATFLEKDFQLKKRVKAAMTYPAVIFVMAILIVFFLVIYVLPTFVQLFKGMNLKLPLITQLLISTVELLRKPAFIAIAGVSLVVIYFAIMSYIKTPSGKRLFDGLILNIPVFGLLNKKVAISRFSRTLSTLLSSGVPIMQALEIVGKASGNSIIEEAVEDVRDSLREGENISGPLEDSGLFPPMVTQMVAVGEETGNLDAMLSKIADFYDTEVEYMLSSLTSMLEPLMIVGMGGMVGFIVLAVFLPLYQIIGNIH